MKLRFFGVLAANDSGHFLHDERGQAGWPGMFGPWRVSEMDGLLQPDGPQTQGAAKLWHRDGYSALAWWDRTGDRRVGSCAVILADEVLDEASLIEHASRVWPAVMARQPRPVVMVGAP